MSVLWLKVGSSRPESSRLEFLEKSSAKSLAFSEAEVKTSGPLNQGGIFKTLLAICPKVTRANSLRNNRFLCFLSKTILSRFNNPFTWITSLSKQSHRTSWFVSLIKMKKWFLCTIATAQEGENQEDEWGLTWYLRLGIYVSIPTCNHSENSEAALDAPYL